MNPFQRSAFAVISYYLMRQVESVASPKIFGGTNCGVQLIGSQIRRSFKIHKFSSSEIDVQLDRSNVLYRVQSRKFIPPSRLEIVSEDTPYDTMYITEWDSRRVEVKDGYGQYYTFVSPRFDQIKIERGPDYQTGKVYQIEY